MSKKKTLSAAERRTLRFEELVRLRQIERLTIEECAHRLNVSPRTVQYYLADDEYEATVARMRIEWKESAITHVADLAQDALETMKRLMSGKDQNGKDVTPHVQWEAARAIGDWLGLGVQKEDVQHDDRDEIDRLTKLLAARPQVVVNEIYTQPVEPGGYLPKPLQKTVDVDQFLAARAQRKQEELHNRVVDSTIEAS